MGTFEIIPQSQVYQGEQEKNPKDLCMERLPNTIKLQYILSQVHYKNEYSSAFSLNTTIYPLLWTLTIIFQCCSEVLFVS